MSSRIFIKNLPPNINDSNIRTHFSCKGAVTDVRVIPHRRIAYVGYKTTQEAEAAVKYFNRSYIQTSKIGVEIARPISAKEISLSGPTHAETPELGSKKRKRDEVEHSTPKAGKKFEQFLKTLTATSTKNSWSNGASEPDYIDTDDVVSPSPPEPNEQPGEILTNALELPHATEENAGEDGVEGDNKAQTLQSEDDWLRSKTSRLLDVTDDIESRLTASVTTKAPRTNRSPTQASHVVPEPMEVDTDQASASAKDIILHTPRLFVRNLPYSATEEELQSKFQEFGPIAEVHLALDTKTNASKGYAYVQYYEVANATRALQSLDGTDFQGRLVHILPAAPRRENKLDEFAIAKLPLKQQRAIKQKAEASMKQFNWNSMYMNADAVISSVAERLGLSKSELLDPTSSDAAVRQAHAETAVINETKSFFQQNGVDLEAFNRPGKDDKVLLIKNFPFTTSADEIRKMLAEFGELKRLLFPPAGTIAIAEFQSTSAGRLAFSALAYRRFKDSVLFLEKGPKNLFESTQPTSSNITDPPSSSAIAPISTESLKTPSALEPGTENSTLYIRNLNFSTTSERLDSFFSSLDGFLWCRVKTKTDSKHPGKVLSMGFGFAEFSSIENAKAAIAYMDGRTIDGHTISVTMARKGGEAAETGAHKPLISRGAQKKIVIKNLPFEVTKKDIRALFSKYGSLHSVRMPKKLGNKTRGFAFAEFVTAREAENAMQALKDTHLLGRRLVLDFAKGDAETVEEEIEKMSKKVLQQTEAVALQGLKLRSKAAVKLNAEGAVEEEDADL